MLRAWPRWSARRAAAATPATTIPYTDDTWGKVNVVLRLRDGRIQVSREPLPEMPAELKALFQERK